jgi:hypothetical protein
MSNVSVAAFVRPKNVSGPGPYWYLNLAVNNRSGTRLLVDGNPLRASRIRVHCPIQENGPNACHWSFANNTSSLVTSPGGTGGSAGGDYIFPGAPFFCVFMSQGNGWREVITATDPEHAQIFDVSNGFDLFTNVNDGNNDASFGDNTGAYSLVVEVLQD